MKTLVKIKEVSKALPYFRRCSIKTETTILDVNRFVLEVPKTNNIGFKKVQKSLNAVNPDICIGKLGNMDLSAEKLSLDLLKHYLCFYYLKKNCKLANADIILAGVSEATAWFWCEYLLKEQVNLFIWDKNYNKSENFAYHIYHRYGKTVVPILNGKFQNIPVLAITKDAEKFWNTGLMLGLSDFEGHFFWQGNCFSLTELGAILYLKEVSIANNISLEAGCAFSQLMENYEILGSCEEKLDFFK
ncbi:MAG: hypothetical protein RR219_04445 [Clostridiales bacterium]